LQAETADDGKAAMNNAVLNIYPVYDHSADGDMMQVIICTGGNMELMEGIYTRRSIRRYTDGPVTREQLLEIIKAGTWAPSGQNNQPWRFVTVTDRNVLAGLAKLTKYSHVIEKAPACIVVFIDKSAMYHEVKDHQSMGACLQNMLLAAHGMGLGAVWLGEILKSSDAVRKLVDVPEQMALMAVIVLGHPEGKGGTSNRKPVEALLLKEL
jgi:nitroreductase